MRARGTIALVVLVGVLGLLAGPAAADDPAFVPWTSVLPSFTTQYVPGATNICNAGQLSCVDAVIAEMTSRFDPLAAACSHNAVFSLTYLRTTEEYRRSVAGGTFFQDTPFVNHQDALFAKYYFDAWDAYRAGNAAAVPQAWQLALSAADGRKVNGAGNLFLGMGAHVNRDLPFVLADIGLVKPDGTSRKPDHDKVNEFLNRVIQPLLIEAGARFDPSISRTEIQGTTVDDTGAMQILIGWREQAWRNAEALVSAPTPQARALVARQIETSAAIEQQLLIASTAYSPIDANLAASAAVSLNAQVTVFGTAQLTALVNAALASRADNVLDGVLNPLLGSASSRDAYCRAHR